MDRLFVLVIGMLLGSLATVDAEVSGLINVSNSTQPVSNSTQPGEGTGHPAVSSDGRWVAFVSNSGIQRDDRNGYYDIHVRHLPTGTLKRISVGYDGSEANHGSDNPYISGDGRFVAFESEASNLVPNDSNGSEDIFVYDQSTGTTEIVSVGTNGTPGTGPVHLDGISGDGRFVLFTSTQPLNAGDRSASFSPSQPLIYFYSGITNTGDPASIYNLGLNIYLRDRQAKTTTYITCGVYPTLSSDGRILTFRRGGSLLVRDLQSGVEEVISQFDLLLLGPSFFSSYVPSISGDGRLVAYQQWSAPGIPEIFVYDRTTRTKTQVTSSFNRSALVKQNPKISADGRYILFFSTVDNFIQGIRELYLYDLSSGDTRPLPTDGTVFPFDPQFDISGDGSVVVFRSHTYLFYPKGNFEIFADIFALRTGVPTGGGGNAGELKEPKITAEPSLLWPPGSKLVDVKLTAEAPGSSAVEFRISDEYGIFTQTANGATATVQLEAWRRGDDEDGRTYTVTAIVTDPDGSQKSATTEVIVPHDKR